MRRLFPLIEIITVVKDDLEGFLLTQKSLEEQKNKNFNWLIIDSSEQGVISETVNYKAADSVSYSWVEPRGIYNAMNYGLNASVGEWIWYLNAGDYLSNPEVISNIIEIIVNSPDIEAVGLTVYHLDQQKYIWGKSRPSIQRNKDNIGLAFANINHQGFLARKETLIQAGSFDESLKHVADTKIIDWVATHKRLSCVDYHAVNFMIGGHSNHNFRHSLKELKKIRHIEISVVSLILDSMLVLKNRARMYAASNQNLVSFLIKTVRDPKTIVSHIFNSSRSK